MKATHFTFLLAVLTGCSSLVHSTKLPIIVHVADVAGSPISGASVEIDWRTGFQGYYWGKSVKKVSDSSGVVRFASEDIPSVSEDGYSLGNQPLHKIIVHTLRVRADGYQTRVVWTPDKIDTVTLEKVQ